MAPTSFDDLERRDLCDLMDALGPDAATVLAPWTTRDLAAHLFLREHDPLAGPGLVVPGPWARLAERHRRQVATRDYGEVVAAVRSGPRGVLALGWLRRVPNLNEFFVHHEDVRRANGHGPRAFSAAMHAALWSNVRSGAMAARPTPSRCGAQLSQHRDRRRGDRAPRSPCGSPRRGTRRTAALPLRPTRGRRRRTRGRPRPGRRGRDDEVRAVTQHDVALTAGS